MTVNLAHDHADRLGNTLADERPHREIYRERFVAEFIEPATRPERRLGVLSIDVVVQCRSEWRLSAGKGVFAESGPHAHRNLRSRSAKNAAERRSKSDLVSAIGSPISIFATEFCATYLMTLFARMTPPLFISEAA
jgi:hypothetical protein